MSWYERWCRWWDEYMTSWPKQIISWWQVYIEHKITFIIELVKIQSKEFQFQVIVSLVLIKEQPGISFSVLILLINLIDNFTLLLVCELKFFSYFWIIKVWPITLEELHKSLADYTGTDIILLWTYSSMHQSKNFSLPDSF